MRKFALFTGMIALLIGSMITTHAQTIVTYVQRAEAAMILLQYTATNVDLRDTSGEPYPDLEDGMWYVPYVRKALATGLLMTEKTTGLVHPQQSVSRAEFLMMMTKVFGLTTNIPYQYVDVPVDSTAARVAGLAWRYALFPEDTHPDHLQPSLRITHQEANTAIVKLMKAEPSLQPHVGMFPIRASDIPTPLTGKAEDSLHSGAGTQTTLQAVVNAISPLTVKEAVLALLRSRVTIADQTRNDMIAALNDYRAQYKLAPLTSNAYLELAAQRHAHDMSTRGYFSHFTPEGRSYIDRIRSGGYLDVHPDSCTCSQQFNLGEGSETQGPDYLITGTQQCGCQPVFALGENLAKGQLTVEQVMKDWINSPHHRDNLLRPEFTEIGIGLYNDLWVQDFGKVTYQ